MMSAATTNPSDIEAADRAARSWRWPDPRPLRPGSEEHKQAACRMFRETFNPYKPAVIDWPKLDPEALQRLTGLPIWNIAVQTEGKARLRMTSYANSLLDPEWREAINQNGWEEGRHKDVLARLVEAYDIRLEPEPPYLEPQDAEWAYLVTGFSECIDSFFAFGLFELAKRSGFFPIELVETFEPVIQEEARHILLFANWLAWHRGRMPLWKRPWFEVRVAAAWAFLVWERIGFAKTVDDGRGTDSNFTVNGSRSVSDDPIKPAMLMRICLEQNDRRFAGYDPRLLRPTTVPRLVRLARHFMRG